MANNYILTHEDVVGTASDRIFIRYKQPKNSNAYWTSTAWQTIAGTNGDTRWHGTNSYAVMMAAGGNERIYTWDENYNISAFDTGIAIDDNSFVNNVNNSMAFLTALDGTVRGYAWRYDGFNWIGSGMMDYYGPNVYFRNLFSLGDDFILRPRPGGNTGMRSFDPATRIWTTSLDIATTFPYILLAGNNFISTDRKFYFKNVDAIDSWTTDGQIFSALANPPGTDYYLQGGIDFVATGISGSSNSLAIRFKNGALLPSLINPQTSIPGLIKDRPNVLFAPAQVGYNAVVTGLGGIANMEDASSLKIYRKWDKNFEGSVSAYVATRIEMNDGAFSTTQFSYEYDLTTAAVEASGTVPQFNRVRSYAGIDLSNGYTDTYFFNGLDPAILNSIDPNAVPSSYFGYSDKRITGAVYRSVTYRNNGLELASSLTNFTSLSFGPNNRSYSILPSISKQITDGQITNSNTTYTAFSTPHTTLVENKSTTAQYFNEVYTSSLHASYNFFFPVSERVSYLSQPRSISYTRWKFFENGGISPYQTYAWKNGSSDFSAYWDPSTTVPSTNWKLINTNVSFNSRGLLTESIDANNVNKSLIYHSTKPLVLAEVTKASSNQILYEGFEYSGANFSSDALTGLKSSTVSYAVNLPSVGSYKLTYWRKVGSSNWELITQTINGNTAIGGIGMLIDEVRLCPSSALMTSYCYDQWGNLITTCDTNNQVSYFEYDEFNRQKLVRDENKNIISYKKYNIKN